MTADLDTFNPFDPETLQCPFPHYAQMRDDRPVMYIESLKLYLVTRHDLVLGILRNPQRYSSQFGGTGMPMPRAEREAISAVFAEGYPRVSTMLTADMPEHTRYRRLVSKAFTPKVVAELEPDIRAITTRLIDSWINDGRIEFVTQFGVPLPVEVIAKALNVPDSRLADFKRWSDDSIAGIGTQISLDDRIRAERGVNEFQHYFAEQLERRRTDPQDDLLTGLVNARIDEDDADVDDKRPLDMPEMLSIVQQLLVAGNETTTKLLTELMRLLAEHPDEWSKLRADPGRAPAVVEEGLRLSTPTQGMFRIATEDHELEGVQIPKGARLVIVFASANRDAALYDDGDGFQPDRENPRDHLAFGKGIHFCLGANLSRLESRVAMEELSRRIESFTLPDTNEYGYFPSFMLRGLTRLDVDFVPASGA
ncbi:MAG: cytochrome P450 [Actinomycetota bacterium]